MSSDDAITMVAYVATYATVEAAEADFELLKEIDQQFDIVDGYDSAVVSRDADGKVHINKTHETPTQAGAVFGGGLGLATGLVAALFPAVALTGGLVLGTTAGGAALGAVAGHVSGGLDRGDLKEFGEQLDQGTAAVIYVGAQNTSERVEEILSKAESVNAKAVKADRAAAVQEAEAAQSS